MALPINTAASDLQKFFGTGIKTLSGSKKLATRRGLPGFANKDYLPNHYPLSKNSGQEYGVDTYEEG